MKRFSDWQLWAALAVALPVWGIAYLWFRPPIILGWPLNHPLLALKLVLFFPLAEEIVFRGLIQDFLHTHLKHQWGYLSAANLLTSLLFAALHLINHAPAWALLVIFPSLVFGYFRERHETLLTPVGLHIFYNAGYFLLLAPPSALL
ncbi:MAG: JDVT-CTERM system glutamic-type intramembrane protease [Gammaproteobacteria bacterium]|jgi:membrane protease YdiL (CAAX protease family)